MAAWITLLSTALASSQTGTLRALLVEYRCPVVDRLDRIYDHPKPTDFLDRFLAVTLTGHPHGYVQCILHGQPDKNSVRSFFRLLLQ